MFLFNDINFTLICKTIIWTLLHSIWQGLFLAIIAGLFIESTKSVKPHIRYNIFLIFGLLFISIVLATFIYEVNLHSSIYNAISNNKDYRGIQIDYPIYIEFDASSDFVLFINEYSIYLILGWLVITLFNFRNILCQSYLNTRITKHIQVNDMLLYWQYKIPELGNYINLKKSVRLGESKYVSAPVLIGYVKPIILLPIGLINNLEAHEVEAILLHELAHVKRHDYLINYIQVLFDCLFFFNPGYLWISKLIRTERENCCDDIVVGKVKDKRIYIKSLIQSLEYQSQFKSSNLVLHFTYQRYQMVSRVERLIYGSNPTLNKFQIMALASALLICLFFFCFHKIHIEAPAFVDKISYQEIKQIVSNKNSQNKQTILKHTCQKNSTSSCYACSKIKPDSNARISMVTSSNHSPQLIQKVIIALLNENVIQDVKNLSFYFDQSKFIVNGNEMASCIASNFREKFLNQDVQFIRYRC
jgi:beta-lactamase regulating signal transducer with metallopeptidase domain